MLRYLGRRIAMLVPTIFLVSVVAFALMHMAPSDPVTMKYSNSGAMMDFQAIASEKAKLGLDKSAPEQYRLWLAGILQGDWGRSYITGKSVAVTMRERLPNTVALTLAVIFLTIVFAYPLGILSTRYENGWPDGVIRFFSFVGTALPTFWAVLLLMYVFGARWKLLPTMGSGDFRHIILPAVSMAMWMVALYVRRIRAGVVAELHQPYIKSMAVRGYSTVRIYLRHILPNASIPVLVMPGLSVGELLGGTMVVEVLFGWQGVGSVALDAVSNRDYAVLQAYVVWMAVIYGVLNLAIDLLLAWLDPRFRRAEIR